MESSKTKQNQAKKNKKQTKPDKERIQQNQTIKQTNIKQIKNQTNLL